MGSRGRSIRLRIYFLVAIPLITMLGLFAYVAYTSVSNFFDLDRAPNLLNATAVPITEFGNLLQDERTAAVVYLSHPGSQGLTGYEKAVAATKAGVGPFNAAMESPGTKASANAQEQAAIDTMVSDFTGNTVAGLRQEVQAQQLTPLQAFQSYTDLIANDSVVFQSEASSLTNGSAATAGLGLIATVNVREDIDEQAAMLAGALASGTLTPQERVVFDQATGREQDDTLSYSALLTPAELTVYNTTQTKLAPGSLQTQMTNIQQDVEGGATVRQLESEGINSTAWAQLTGALANANFQAGTHAAVGVLATDRQLATDAKNRVWLTGAGGAAGLILTLIITILLGQSINRRLTRLRRSALTLAQKQLPAVVTRLRRGEDVDVAAEAPSLRVGTDEIGQVGQAIETVRQTAIRAAVEEANLRRGVNDVFRNLARRNQSLLQRQLTVLDGMERRATDPDVLDDLFKLDHLTTRMRRHAEGLIILSGAAPGRGWSAPVRLVDVMRGAVSEVEDYARVTVTTQSRVAVAGSAVTDVIHLLAELIENATTLSPPFTQVRVAGEIVANGFAIEIEDRGLGMTPSRMAELNERLSNPPDVNPANTEQLGLFVVGNLARRHGIGVMLRPSPYGGTTAVALIPQRLIVEEGPAAITAGHDAMPGDIMHGGVAMANGAINGVNGFGPAHGVPGGSGATFPTFTPAGGEPMASGLAGFGPESMGPAGPASPMPPRSPMPPPSPARPTTPHTPIGSPPDLDNIPIGNSSYGSAPGFRISGPVRRSDPAGGEPIYDQGGAPLPPLPGRRGSRHGTDGDVPVVTGVPIDRSRTPAPFDAADQSFDVFTPRNQPEQGGGYDYGTRSDRPSSGDYGTPTIGRDPEGYPNGGAENTLREDYKGLPRRVRQANLAPQLRSSADQGAEGPTAVPQASAPSPTDVRNTLSAMQRGWQQGRTQPQQKREGSVDGE
jgi:signal transduction histidine kinase